MGAARAWTAPASRPVAATIGAPPAFEACCAAGETQAGQRPKTNPVAVAEWEPICTRAELEKVTEILDAPVRERGWRMAEVLCSGSPGGSAEKPCTAPATRGQALPRTPRGPTSSTRWNWPTTVPSGRDSGRHRQPGTTAGTRSYRIGKAVRGESDL